MNKILSIPMRLLCAVCFCTFSFSYLYFYQADVMFVIQRIASQGQTHYVSITGAIIITLTLQLLQIGVFSITKLYKRFHAITYFPSFLGLAFLTDIPSETYDSIEYGSWLWIVPLLLILFAILSWLAYKYQSMEPDLRYDGPSSQLIWISLSTMGLMMLITGITGNGNRNFHHRAQMEHELFLEVQSLSEQCDTIDNPAWRAMDKELTQLLVKKNLSRFARCLARRFDVSQPFPRHYAEALVLNTRFTHPPQVYWRNKVMEEEFNEFIRAAAEARKSAIAFRELEKRYGRSYWFYYYFIL